MNRRHLPLNALRTFEALGNHLHMGRAAEELGVTYSAVSHQIKRLEELLGVTLFNRGGKKLQLTARGRHLYDEVKVGFDKLANATLHVDPAILNGTLTVGCAPSLCANWLLDVLGGFLKEHPGIDIKLREVKPLAHELPADVDVTILFGSPIANKRAIRLIQAEHFPVANPELFGTNPPPQTIDELMSYPLLMDSYNEDEWENLMLRFDTRLSKEKHFIELFDPAHVIEAARKGLGIAMAHQLEVSKDLHNGALIRLLDISLPSKFSYYLITDNEPTLRAQIFEDWVRQQAGLKMAL